MLRKDFIPPGDDQIGILSNHTLDPSQIASLDMDGPFQAKSFSIPMVFRFPIMSSDLHMDRTMVTTVNQEYEPKYSEQFRHTLSSCKIRYYFRYL